MAEYAQGSDQEQGSPLPPLPDVTALGVGEALRKRRDQLGWAIEDVAAWLRIRSVYLEALENGHANVLPAEVYALGFLRTYGQALGFDPDQLLKLYRQENRLGGRKPDLDFPDPPPDRRLPPAVSISLGLAVILASYVGWYCFVGHVPPVPERVPPVATLMPGESAKNSPSPQVASILPDHTTVQSPVVPAGMPAAPAQAAPVVPEMADAAPNHGVANPADGVPPPAVGVLGAPVQPQGVEQAAPSTPDVPAVAEGAPLVLKALAPSWVQVKNASGKVVYDHILQPGDAWNVPTDNGPYSLTVGNAGGIVLAQGTQTTPPMGRNGAVLRHVALTPEVVQQLQSGGTPVSAPVLAAPVEGVPAGAVGGSVHPPENSAKTDGPAPPVAGAGGADGVAVKPPVMEAKPVMHRAAAVPEPSADDLNARQLNGLGTH